MAITVRATIPAEYRGPRRPNAVTTQQCCVRCGGLMVEESCIDLLNVHGMQDYPARRCVQCGEIVDQIILHNRIRQQDTVASSNGVAA